MTSKKRSIQFERMVSKARYTFFSYVIWYNLDLVFSPILTDSKVFDII